MDKINLKAVLLQNMGEDSADFLPIMGDEKELLNDNMQIPDTLPILPLRNTVLFPGVIIPINIFKVDQRFLPAECPDRSSCTKRYQY